MIGKVAGAAAMYQAMTSLGFAAESGYTSEPGLHGPRQGRRVLILGAGIAGMAAAYEMHRAGYEVKILEYQNRTSGRCLTLRGGDRHIEMGGHEIACDFEGDGYLNAGPLRLPVHHRAVFDYCRTLLALVAIAVPAKQAPTNADTALASIDALLSRFSGDPDRFTQTDGEALYAATCQACHMEDGRGDQGAGAYPPLAGNPKMMSKHFLAGVILTGYHGMPRFGDMMSDEQVATATNHVRSHFGNVYTDPITPEQVSALLPPEDMD